MIDVYIGVVGDPKSVLALEFDSIPEATKFCDEVTQHYKEERKQLYLSIDNSSYYDMGIVYTEEEKPMNGEIDIDIFREIIAMQEK